MTKGNYKYSPGMRIGSFILNNFTNSLWEIICDCGNTVKVRSNHLYRKKSCGCLSKSNRCKSQDKLITLINKKINHYKSGAHRRKLNFELSKIEFTELINGNCYYCKYPPHLDHFYKDFKIKLNGVDRVDSSKGYTTDNCVSCCSMCNRAKSDMSESNFKNWIKWIKNND